MASSSYCDLVIPLKAGDSIAYSGEDGSTPLFAIPADAKKILSEITTIDELIAFVVKCAAVCEAGDVEAAQTTYEEECADFDAQLREISSLEAIDSFILTWGEYDPDDGEHPKYGCAGERLEYNFTTKKCKTKKTPDRWFVRDMIDIYGDLFEEDDE